MAMSQATIKGLQSRINLRLGMIAQSEKVIAELSKPIHHPFSRSEYMRKAEEDSRAYHIKRAERNIRNAQEQICKYQTMMIKGAN